jgi:transcriptional regulator with XRE-family HTH domain
MSMGVMGKNPIDDGQDSGQVPTMAFDWRKRLQNELTLQERDMKEVSVTAGLGETYIRDALKRGRGGKIENLQKIARALKKPDNWLIGPTEPLISSFDPDAPDGDESPHDLEAAEAARRAARRELRPGEIIERDVRGGLGLGGFADQVVVDGQAADGVRATWTMPVAFLHTELRVRESEVDIIPVDGDSMIPTLLPGDRVMIHRGATAPAPDGIFAIDDGIGVSVKRLQLVRGSDPLMIRIISDNPSHAEDRVPVENLRVLGRVIMKMSRM